MDDDGNNDGNNDGNDDEFFDVFEDYSHPAFVPENSKLPREDRFMWILIWIMKFRSNYNLPNTATEASIKFVKILCENIDHESFPNTLYKAKNH